MSRLAAPLSIAALVLLAACVPDDGPRSSYYRDGYYGGSSYGYGYGRDSSYRDGSYRSGYRDGYRAAYRRGPPGAYDQSSIYWPPGP
ncbi:hypothetical protein FHP25_20055 [Vineibacter terrae]|uniref:Lipoprotein n=1 Tax=Vineibacter terrae TaxID=2586908 RepID=A0A5C8PIR6_9HYPH|nr:hypothetical protein [Vineibacter terrae]TXL73705.1 hypothetical protein FHP25_20055 [Vineibacter terrae]